MVSVLEVFFRPGKLFGSLAERPRSWVAALIADTVVLICNSYVVTRFIGLDTIVRQRLQSANLSPEQMQQAMHRMQSPVATYMGYFGAGFSTVLILVIISLITMMTSVLIGGKAGFGSIFSMVAHAMLPCWFVTLVMTTLVILLSPDRATLDITNLIATNIGAFVDKATVSKFVYSLLVSVDLLSLLAVGMLSYGFSKVTRSSLSTGCLAAGSMWLLFVLAKAAASSFV